MKTILLTGATGFLGSHILKAILSKTDDNIIILKRSFSDIWRIKTEIESKRVTYYDIDKTSLSSINWENIDTIIHCATEYGRNKNSCLKVLETNLMLPIELIENAIEHGVATFINTDFYFNKENLSYSYLRNYSLSKKSLNLWLKQFSKNIKIINLVLEHIYGEYDNSNKFIEKVIQKVAIEQVNNINLTSGDQKRDFIYVEDVADTYIAAINFGRNNLFRYRQFSVGTGISYSLKDFCNLVKSLSKSKTNLDYGKIPYREDEIMNSVADTMELNSLLDTSKFYTIKEGISKILQIYKEVNLIKKS